MHAQHKILRVFFSQNLNSQTVDLFFSGVDFNNSFCYSPFLLSNNHSCNIEISTRVNYTMKT